MRIWFIAIAAFVGAISQAAAQDLPVMAGGDPTKNACSGSGEIVGLDPHGDGFLSVRDGPGGRPFAEIDRIFNGQSVRICEHRGPWLVVIYGPAGTDWGLGAPRSIRQAYTGPCRSGWVFSKYVSIAGAELLTCHCDFPPDRFRVRPDEGRTNEANPV
jgi:hypothetical protein